MKAIVMRRVLSVWFDQNSIAICVLLFPLSSATLILALVPLAKGASRLGLCMSFGIPTLIVVSMLMWDLVSMTKALPIHQQTIYGGAPGGGKTAKMEKMAKKAKAEGKTVVWPLTSLAKKVVKDL